jgi:putative ABC transport system permease protein
MLYNYITIAFRNLVKNRLFTALNVLGLSTGLAVALLMGLFVRDEWSFDLFHENADRIYRINNDAYMSGVATAYAVSSAPMGAAFVRDYPAVEAACRFRQWGFITLKKGLESIEEGPITYVDSTFFQVFSFPLKEGDPRTALSDPQGMVITERIAEKYFGASTGVVGRTLRMNDMTEVKVTGVLQKIPAQSHIQYDIYFPMSQIAEAKSDVWLSNNFNTYLLLRKGASPDQFPAYFDEILEKHFLPQLQKIAGLTKEDLLKSGDRITYSLQNIRDIHLKSDRVAEMDVNSDIKYVWIFGSVALMVLLLACVNFMNLSTARSANRVKEVGVRKTLGSHRGALIGQFLVESFILTAISFVIAILLVKISIPAFNLFSGKEIVFSLADMPLLLALGGLMAGTAFVAGSYPAFFLSKFRPIQALRGSSAYNGKTGAAAFRSALVIFQFFASIALMSAVFVVQRQMTYIQQKKLGWDKEAVVMLRNTWWLQGKTLDFKARLLEIPGIEQVSGADFFPTPSPRNSLAITPLGNGKANQTVNSQFWEVDFDYKNVMGLTMKAGRWFDARLANDSVACIINESAAKMFGWSDPIGQKIETFIDPQVQQKIQASIIGVVENFHFESLRDNISPLVMVIGRGSGTMALRLAAKADKEQALVAVGALYKNYLPGKPFNYRFLDDEFDRQYNTERRIGNILGAFAGFAIFIACLGLFGLAAFMAEQRTKEIGIRKVLGASIGSVVGLLSRDFLRLVLIAIVLASPVAYYFMQQWLADFAYRIDLQWWIFAGAGAAAVAIAFVTVSFQSIRAALANPIKSLRSE